MVFQLMLSALVFSVPQAISGGQPFSDDYSFKAEGHIYAQQCGAIMMSYDLSGDTYNNVVYVTVNAQLDLYFNTEGNFLLKPVSIEYQLETYNFDTKSYVAYTSVSYTNFDLSLGYSDSPTYDNLNTINILVEDDGGDIDLTYYDDYLASPVILYSFLEGGSNISYQYYRLDTDLSNLYNTINNFIVKSGYVLDDPYAVGYQDGRIDGEKIGYQNGYVNGYNEGSNQDATAVVIFSGIINVALLPINVFLGILNFEVFGINIGGIVSAFLTISIVIIIVRIITGKKATD